MKKKILALFILVYVVNMDCWGQTTIWSEDFESDGSGSRYTTSITEFTDSGADYFLRTDGTDITGESFSNIKGSYYFAAQDIDGEGASLPVTLSFDDIDISGKSSIQFSIYLAEDDDGSNQDWDGADYVHVDYDVDNSGSFTNLIWIENDGDGLNARPLIDTDFDGSGDGTEITSTFTQFTADIATTGSTIDIRITFELDSGDEDIALDNLELTESAVTPEPTNQATSLAANAISYKQIDLTWSDNDGAQAADNFLLLVSSSSPITAPVDGASQSDDTDFSDGEGVVNIASEAESYSATGLTAATTYYFAIYPYTNSGESINYKTDGDVATANETTDTLKLIISEVADPEDSTDARFVELYNHGSSTIDLSSGNFYLAKQVNGGTWYNIALSDSVQAGSTYVIAGSQTDYELNYGKVASQYNSFISGNGDDGYFLYYNGDNTSGILLDAFGEIDVDGTGELWEYTNSKAVRKTTVTVPETSWANSDWNILSANVESFNPGSYPATTWNGSVDSDWTNSTNWDNGLPDATISVHVPAELSNYPTVSSSQSINNLTVNSDATLLGAEYLTISGTAMVKRELSVDQWQYITPPISDATANDIEITTEGESAYLIEYDNTVAGSGANLNNGWNYITSDTNVLETGKGYGVQVTDSKTINFTGSLLTGNQTITGLIAGDSGSNPWVLIGNSALAYVDWSGIDDDDDITANAYFYDGTNARYATISHSGIVANTTTTLIPPMQGFFVEVDANADESLLLPTSALTHGSQAFYKNKIVARNFIRLAICKGDYSDETVFYFSRNAENAYNSQSDAHKLIATKEGFPQIYSQVENHNLIINALNKWPVSIPFAIESSSSETLTLKVLEIENLDHDLKVYIEDKLTGKIYNVSKNLEIEINVKNGNSNDRFALHFTNTTTSAFDVQSNNIAVNVFNNCISVDNISSIAKVDVYSISGQKVVSETISRKNNKLSQVFRKGIYIVKVACSDNRSRTFKIHIE